MCSGATLMARPQARGLPRSATPRWADLGGATDLNALPRVKPPFGDCRPGSWKSNAATSCRPIFD